LGVLFFRNQCFQKLVFLGRWVVFGSVLFFEKFPCTISRAWEVGVGLILGDSGQGILVQHGAFCGFVLGLAARDSRGPPGGPEKNS